MSQSRRFSAMEAITNVLVGYGVNFAANLIIFPQYGWNLSLTSNLEIGVIYTAISLVRSYILRRIYNRIRQP